MRIATGTSVYRVCKLTHFPLCGDVGCHSIVWQQTNGTNIECPRNSGQKRADDFSITPATKGTLSWPLNQAPQKC